MAAPTREPDGQRDDPGVAAGRSPRPKVLGIHSAWSMAMNMPGEAEDRPDRQVDVARHDDQDHARRHDRDGRALDRQVPQVARRQEQAVGHEVEHDPDDDGRDDQAERAACRSRAPAGATDRRSPRRLLRHGRSGAWTASVISAPRSSRLGIGTRPAPRRNRGAGRRCLRRASATQAATDPAGTSLHRASLVIQPASTTRLEVVLQDRDAA